METLLDRRLTDAPFLTLDGMRIIYELNAR